ncbi:MAG: hypothetical protein GXY08_06290 [Ruminococcus sp.]|nr:hypothetical protein [Ruminococcus sp.]
MKKDLMDMLGQPDEAELEKLAENSPLPDEAMKERIVRACLAKTGEAPEEQAADTAGGTEIYRRPRWTALAAAAAAFAIVIAGGAGIVMIGKNMKKTAPASIESSSDVITAPAPAPFEEPATSNDLKSGDTVSSVSGTKPNVTAYVAGANETSTTAAESATESGAVEPATGGAPVDTGRSGEMPIVTATVITDPDIPTVTQPVEFSESGNSDSQAVHLPNYGAVLSGNWSSTGGHGNMSWSFYAGKDSVNPANGGKGECYQDGELYGEFSYYIFDGEITITWTSGKLACTGMKGTVSGMVNGRPTDPFDITWDSGETDYFKYDYKDKLEKNAYEPYFVEAR